MRYVYIFSIYTPVCMYIYLSLSLYIYIYGTPPPPHMPTLFPLRCHGRV